MPTHIIVIIAAFLVGGAAVLLYRFLWRRINRMRGYKVRKTPGMAAIPAFVITAVIATIGLVCLTRLVLDLPGGVITIAATLGCGAAEWLTVSKPRWR